MSTSGAGGLNAVGYLVAVLAALMVAARGRGGLGRSLTRPAPAALGLWLVVAVPSILQFPLPAVFDALSRRPGLIVRGEVWRLLTSVVVQDGGVVGTVSNLVFLYLVACAAVPLWGPLRTVALFVVGAVGFDLMATFAYPQPGAGNSGATFVLASSLVAAAAVHRRSAGPVVAGVLTVVVGAGLLVLGDAHGFAFLGGLLLGGVLAVVVPPVRRPVPAG